jgi:hypothetical protein
MSLFLLPARIARALDICRSHKYIRNWEYLNLWPIVSAISILVFCDVTNYYFEINEQDDLRQRGVGKEHRPNPIVQMGFLMDKQRLSISYELFSGNTNDYCRRYKRQKGVRKYIKGLKVDPKTGEILSAKNNVSKSGQNS